MSQSKHVLWERGSLHCLTLAVKLTLICQSYFEREILSYIVLLSGEKAEADQLFQLTAANNRKLSVSVYVKLDLDLVGIMVPKVGVLIT